MTQLLGVLTSYLSGHFLVALVWLVGAILAILSWRQHPRVSRLTLIALVILFVESWVRIYANLYLPLLLRDRGWSNSQLAALYYPLQSVILSVIQAGAWGLIVAAIFSRRD